MKNAPLIGGLIVALLVVIAVVMAGQMGEKSPILAAGKITLSDDLVPKAQGIETLFLILYDADSPMPMPYGAVKERLSADAVKPGWTYEFYITKEKIQTMRPDAPAPQHLRIKARLDRDGTAGPDQPGDLAGEVAGVNLGTQDVMLAISRYVPEAQ